jgi:D-aminopeptidase
VSPQSAVVAFDEKKVDAIVALLDQCHEPGAAVGIAIAGRPVYAKGFGLASIDLPVVLSPSMRMRIGSSSKHFTCLAYLLLCEEGFARLDDPIRRWLPELHPITHGVTVRQLMGNTSGLRDAFDLIWQFSGEGRPISSAEVLAYYRDIADVNFAPGTAWAYNNGGFLILTAITERIAGKKLEEVLRERIFQPVGMHDTLLRRWDTDFLPHSATLHSRDSAGGYQKSFARTALSGEGGIVSTVDDMLRWLAHMDAPRVGRAETWSLIKESQILPNGTCTGYGLGLQRGHYRGVETLWHAGSVTGGNSQMLKVPAAGLDVVIMLNRRDISGAQLVDRILDACLPGLEPVAPLGRSPVTGTFRSPTTGRVAQLSVSGASPPWIEAGQQIVWIDGCDIPLEPDANGVLRAAGIFDFVKLGLTPVGDPTNPSSIRCNDFGNLDELIAVLSVAGADASAIVGQYRSDTTGIEATIVETDGGPELSTAGRFGTASYTLENVAAGIWRAASMSQIPWGGGLSFDADRAAFRFSSAQRTLALVFRRSP